MMINFILRIFGISSIILSYFSYIESKASLIKGASIVNKAVQSVNKGILKSVHVQKDMPKVLKTNSAQQLLKKLNLTDKNQEKQSDNKSKRVKIIEPINDNSSTSQTNLETQVGIRFKTSRFEKTGDLGETSANTQKTILPKPPIRSSSIRLTDTYLKPETTDDLLGTKRKMVNKYLLNVNVNGDELLNYEKMPVEFTKCDIISRMEATSNIRLKYNIYSSEYYKLFGQESGSSVVTRGRNSNENFQPITDISIQEKLGKINYNFFEANQKSLIGSSTGRHRVMSVSKLMDMQENVIKKLSPSALKIYKLRLEEEVKLRKDIHTAFSTDKMKFELEMLNLKLEYVKNIKYLKNKDLEYSMYVEAYTSFEDISNMSEQRLKEYTLNLHEAKNVLSKNKHIQYAYIEKLINLKLNYIEELKEIRSNKGDYQ